jgi:hypothetical protein
MHMQAAVRHIAVIALAASPLCASAQGWFAGGTVGQAQQDDYSIGGPISVRDDTDTAYRVFGGFMISDIQGVIASYVDLGTAYYSGPAFGGFTDRLSAEGFDMSYYIGWPPGDQDRVRIFGTLGVFAFDQDLVFTELGTSTSYRDKDDGAGLSLGLGVEINLDAAGENPWSIVAQWQLFKDVGDVNFSGHEHDRQMLSVGVRYRLGGG